MGVLQCFAFIEIQEKRIPGFSLYAYKHFSQTLKRAKHCWYYALKPKTLNWTGARAVVAMLM